MRSEAGFNECFILWGQWRTLQFKQLPQHGFPLSLIQARQLGNDLCRAHTGTILASVDQVMRYVSTHYRGVLPTNLDSRKTRVFSLVSGSYYLREVRVSVSFGTPFLPKHELSPILGNNTHGCMKAQEYRGITGD